MILKIDRIEVATILLGVWYAFSYIQIGYLYDCTSWYRLVFLGTRIVLIIFTWSMYFIQKKHREMNYLMAIGIAFFSFLFLATTILNRGKIMSCFLLLISFITIFLFFEILDAEQLVFCLRGVVFSLWFLLIAQIISMILNPTGLYNYQMGRSYYFFGHVNYSGKILVWGVALQALIEKNDGKPMKKTFVYWLLSLVTVCISKSYVSIVGVVVLGALLYCERWIKISSKWILLGNVVINLGLIIVHSFLNNLQDLVVVLYKIGRMSSLTIRFSIWEQGLRTAFNQIIGHGYVDDYSKYIRYGKYFPSSAHNLNIDILISVGLFGLAAFYLYLFVLTNNSEKSEIAYPVFCTALACAFMWNFEPYLATPVFLLLNTGLVILYNSRTKLR